jgi:hypothetical protein
LPPASCISPPKPVKAAESRVWHALVLQILATDLAAILGQIRAPKKPKMCKSRFRNDLERRPSYPVLLQDELHNWLLLTDLKIKKRRP